MDKVNLKDVINVGNIKNTNITISEYRITIRGQQVEAFFENYIDTGETFLKNAWITTQK
jgi:hypothetical protein